MLIVDEIWDEFPGKLAEVDFASTWLLTSSMSINMNEDFYDILTDESLNKKSKRKISGTSISNFFGLKHLHNPYRITMHSKICD